MNQALECMYLPCTLYGETHKINYTQDSIKWNNKLQYLVEANSIQRLSFSTLAYYNYVGYLISGDKTDSKQANGYKYNMANIVKLHIFLFHIRELYSIFHNLWYSLLWYSLL